MARDSLELPEKLSELCGSRVVQYVPPMFALKVALATHCEPTGLETQAMLLGSAVNVIATGSPIWKPQLEQLVLLTVPLMQYCCCATSFETEKSTKHKKIGPLFRRPKADGMSLRFNILAENISSPDWSSI